MVVCGRARQEHMKVALLRDKVLSLHVLFSIHAMKVFVPFTD